MSITAATAKNQTPASPLSISLTIAANDYVVGCYTDDSSASVNMTSYGTPLVEDFHGRSTADGMNFYAASGKATGSLSSVSCTCGDTIIGILGTFTGVDTTTPKDTVVTTGSSNTSASATSALAITTATANAMLVLVVGWDEPGTSAITTTITDDSSGALSWTIVSADESAGFRHLAFAYAIAPSATTYNVTAHNNHNSGWAAVLYALRPAAGGGVTVSVPAGSLSLTGQVPTVTTTANQTISVPAGALTLTAQAPTVLTPVTVAVPTGALSLTGQIPTVQVSANITVNVPAGSLALTGQVPTVTATANQTIDVPAGALTLTGFAPAVITNGSIVIDVPSGSLSITGYAPNVSGDPIIIPVVTDTGSVPGFVKTKKKGPVMREGQVFGEEYPISPFLETVKRNVPRETLHLPTKTPVQPKEDESIMHAVIHLMHEMI